jgi:hypothetical protein
VRAVLIVLVAVATAHAQPATDSEPPVDMTETDRDRISHALRQIASLEQQLEYEKALVLADRTLEKGLASRDQLADLHLIAGRLAAGLDHPEIAQQHFAKVLALRPDTTLVEGTSPKLQAPFEAAKAAPHELAIALTGGRLVVTRDDLHLVQGTRTHDGVIEAFDERGNQVFWADLPIVTTRSRAWIPWAAASGATLIAGGLAAWRYRVAQDEWNLENDGMHDYSRLHALEDRGQRWAIAADVGFGLAAATAVTAVILFATGSSSERVGVAITSTSAGLVAHF